MNTLWDALLTFIVSIVIVAVIIGSYVLISLARDRRRLARQAQANCRLLHDDVWDITVDENIIATLTPAGPPEDLNTLFITFDVNVIPGCEDDVERLLYDCNKRNPEDRRICFRSRTREGVMLMDSQVLCCRVGQGQVSLKAYPTADQIPSAQGSSRPAT